MSRLRRVSFADACRGWALAFFKQPMLKAQEDFAEA